MIKFQIRTRSLLQQTGTNSSAKPSCKLHELLPCLSCGRQMLRIVRTLPNKPIVNTWASPSSSLATPLPPRDLPHSPGTFQIYTIDTDTRPCKQEVKCLLLLGNHHLGSTRLDHPTGALTTLLTSASALRRELDTREPRLPLLPQTHVYLPRTTSATPPRSTRLKDMPSSTPPTQRPWLLYSVCLTTPTARIPANLICRLRAAWTCYKC